MDSDAEMIERHGRLLARFADQAASLAEDLHACALAAGTPEEKQALALAFQRTGRALRQTLALEARLRRDVKREARLDEERADKLAQARSRARKDRVQAAVEQIIWDEAEEDDQEGFLALLDERLEREDLADPDEPVEALVRRVAAEIGLEVPSPLAGEGVGPGPTDEGSHGHRDIPSPAEPDSPAQPLVESADAAHLLPQRETDRDYWNSA